MAPSCRVRQCTQHVAQIRFVHRTAQAQMGSGYIQLDHAQSGGFARRLQRGVDRHRCADIRFDLYG